MKRVAIAATLLAFGLAGCGGDAFQAEKIGKSWNVSKVPYHGRTIECITRTSDGADGFDLIAISCDFEAFHSNGVDR